MLIRDPFVVANLLVGDNVQCNDVCMCVCFEQETDVFLLPFRSALSR